jgi:(p)ppGpp synthase/HD superfamily hydrolase
MNTKDKNLLLRARAFASRRHAAQTYDDRPYTVHLDAVVFELCSFGVDDPDVLAAAYLHDTLEDTDTTYVELVAKFGEPVARLVLAVTDEPGRNRAERHANTYPKIAREPGATCLKLADRLANTKQSGQHNPSLLAMYRKEHRTRTKGDGSIVVGFRDALYREGEHEAMWAALDARLAA